MKKSINYLIVVVLSFMLVMSIPANAFAVSNAEKAKKAYNSWIGSNDFNDTKIIDIDEDGIPELLAWTFGGSWIYKYNKNNGKVVQLATLNTGSFIGIYYNTNKHTVSLTSHGSGWTYYYFYKIKGMKAKKVGSYKTEKDYEKYEYVFKINGKKVSSNKFGKKLDKKLKNYEKLENH